MISLQNQKKTCQLRTVHKAVTGVIPDAKDIYFSLNYGELIIVFADGETCLFSSLSDGYRNVLAMAADIAIRASALNPFLADKAVPETPGIVLIDELDLHLHPKWQRRIVQDLRQVFPRIQFIVATHAPQILMGAQPGEINILKKDEDSKIQIHRYDIPPGLRTDQVLTGEWFGLQSTLDPWNDSFRNHAVVVTLNGSVYDPSYGRKFSSLTEWQEDSLDVISFIHTTTGDYSYLVNPGNCLVEYQGALW